MPPKKKAAAPTTLVGEFDVELMTQNELKAYIKALEDEHERMRKARNLFQRDNSELLSFLNSLRDDMIHNKKITVQKNIALKDQILEQEKKSKFEDELITVKEIEDINQAEKDRIETYINLITTKIRNKEKEQELLNSINEKDREIDYLEFIRELISTESKENYLTEQTETSKTFRNTFENLVTDNLNNYLEARENFSQNKIENLQAIWGEIPIAEYNPFSDELEKMSVYFEDIYWKNIKTLEKLQFVLHELETELKDITSNISNVTKKSSELFFEDCRLSPRRSLTKTPSISPNTLRKLEELTCENYLLSNKLEIAKKEYHDLKKKFEFAVRKIYQTVDLKVFLLEKKLYTTKQSYPGRFA